MILRRRCRFSYEFDCPCCVRDSLFWFTMPNVYFITVWKAIVCWLRRRIGFCLGMVQSFCLSRATDICFLRQIAFPPGGPNMIYQIVGVCNCWYDLCLVVIWTWKQSCQRICWTCQHSFCFVCLGAALLVLFVAAAMCQDQCWYFALACNSQGLSVVWFEFGFASVIIFVLKPACLRRLFPPGHNRRPCAYGQIFLGPLPGGQQRLLIRGHIQSPKTGIGRTKHNRWHRKTFIDKHNCMTSMKYRGRRLQPFGQAKFAKCSLHKQINRFYKYANANRWAGGLANCQVQLKQRTWISEV